MKQFLHLILQFEPTANSTELVYWNSLVAT